MPAVNPANNQFTGTGFTSGPKGNLLGLNSFSFVYDPESRMSSATTGSFVESYNYDESNRRVEKQSSSGDEISFYGADGKLLTIFTGTTQFQTSASRVYFGSMLLGSTNGTTTSDAPVFADRLGTVTPGYPYGTAIGSPAANDQVDFATYLKDGSTGLDYAISRHYGEGIGRFIEVDPLAGSAVGSVPGTWNRYSYVAGDPVNATDPTGMFLMGPGGGGDDGGYPGDGGATPTCEAHGFWNSGGFDIGWEPPSLFSGGSMNLLCDAMIPFEAAANEGGGGSSNNGGFKTKPRMAARVAWRYLLTVWKDCLNDFATMAGFDPSGFKATLEGMNWVDESTVASQPLSSFESTTSTETVGQYAAQSPSATALYLTNTSNVLILPDYYTSLTQTQQIAVTIHEALHDYLGLNDSDLETWLAKYAGMTVIPNAPSDQITNFRVGTADHMSTVGGGCNNAGNSKM